MKNLFSTLPVAKEIWNASYCLSHSMLNHRTCYLLWWIFKVSKVKPLSPLVIKKSFPWWNYYPLLSVLLISQDFQHHIQILSVIPYFYSVSLVIKLLSRFVNWIQVCRQRVECIFKCKYQTSAMCWVQVSNQYHNSLTVTV